MKKITIITAILLISNLLSAQWIKQNQNYPDNHVLNDIFFIDQYNGWTVGAYGLHTDNSGLDWDWTWLHVYMDYGEKVFFTDANNGWVCGGQQICHTTDGGLGLESWVPQNINLSPQQYLNSIFFIDSLNGWAYGYYDNGITIGGDLFKTTDGGNNWEWQYNMLTLSDMYFLNESIGYCAGYNFQYTTDGGDSWNSAEINMWASSLDVIDENNFWIAGYDDNEKGIIKSSNDGGLTWNKKLGDTIQPLNDVTFIDSNNGWAVGDSGTILHTSDGGNNWEFQESGTIADLNSVFFVDENYGWICGDSSIILHTDNGGVSDHCLPEGITFTTQEQIDNFQTDYPGCTEIEGNVIIEESDIINLNGLSVLTSIGGSLVVYGNNALTNFTGLEGLTTIGNCLEFFRNDSLTSLSGLEGLTTIGGYLSIGYNDWGLPGNQSLTSLEGLSNLTSVGTKLEVLGNPSLTSLSGLDNIEAVSIQSISIAGNNSLSACEVKSICDYLVSPNGSINIYDNAPGCNSPEEVEQECMSHCLPEGIIFTTQAQIDSFAINYPGCTEIEGDVIVAGNDITNLNGLNVIVSVGGDLSVHNNAILTSLSGLDNLTSIGGYLEISRNDSLSSLVGLRNVTAIGESVYIGSHDILWGGNPTLTNLNGLEGLTSIEGDLYISLNIALVSLSGLDNLISIGGSLSVRYTALNSLEGLEKLTSIEGNLNVDSNGILTSLTGLENIDAGSIIYLSIYNNELLSTCEVQSICDYLVAPNGEVSIYNNAPGCNSQQEVEEACASFIADTEGDYDISMYPNPVSTNAILGGEFGSCKTIHICLYNTTGICLKSWEFKNQQSSQQEFTLNVSNLPPGIYFLHLQAGNEVVTKKVVKL